MGSVSFLGLSSGTDWNSVIQQLVQVERRPLDIITRARNQIAFNQSAMSRVNTQLGKLNSQLSNMRFESTFLSRKVESSSLARISATVDAGAATGTHTVQISRLAAAGRASSGLEGELYNKVANLSPTQTMGIGGLVPFADFQPTRALASTLIRDTLQAGKNGSAITAGDTISISGNLKNGTAVSGSFTFNGDSSDTLQRLATTVAQVFHGEISGSVGSNGELVFIETDPSVAGDISFNTTVPPLGIAFNDNDYSGSTLDFGIGNTVAGAGATQRRLVHSVTFTTAGAVELNAATDLALLDNVVSGALNVGDKIRISGNESGGSAIAVTDFTYTGAAGGQSIADLVAAITAAYTTGTASYENGKIVLKDNGSGASSLSLNLQFIDTLGATEFELGSFAVAEVGRSAASQMVTTGSFTVEGTGEHLLSSSEGKAGRIRGNTTLIDPSNTLGSYGVTEFDLLTIDVDGAGGALGPRTVTGLSEYSTLQDMVDLINAQIPAVTAQLVQVGGSYRLEVLANQGGRNIRMYDVAGGILDKVFSTGATDLDSSTNDLSATFAATTDPDDFTMIDLFTPLNGGPQQRRAVTGDEGFPVTELIGGVAINGGGGEFDEGVATVVTANSAELNTRMDMRTYLFGSANIATSPPAGIPFIDPGKPLAEAGFALTPQNAVDNPGFHTDGFFTINGVRINVGDVNSISLNQILGAINTSGAGVTAFLDSANARIYLRSNLVGQQNIALGGNGDTSNFLTIAGLTTTAGATRVDGQLKGNLDTTLPVAQSGFTQGVSSGVFTINGTKITIDAGVDSLTDVLSKINRSGAGVTASYDAVVDRITLAQKLDSPGQPLRISVGDPADTSNFLEAANLTADTTVTREIGSQRQTALFSVDGISYERDSNTVSDVLEKVQLSLNSTTAGPESLTISGDTERLQNAIIDFIVAYNATMELINAKPLSREERSKTADLTDEQANSMTVEQINDYLTEQQELKTRQFIASDNSLRQISNQLQSRITGLVRNSGAFQSLSQLGIATSEVGAGAEAAAVTLGRLLAPTSDRETIAALVGSNADLLKAIAEQSEDLYTLFANVMESRYTHSGTVNLSSGINVSSSLRFTIGNGAGAVAINLTAGHYAQNTLLNIINSRIGSAGLSSSLLAFYDASNQLNIRSASTDSQARLQILDQSTGSDSVLGLLGLEPGLYNGPDPSISGGVALRTRSYVNSLIEVGGVVLERIKQGGSFDREIDDYDKRISQLQANLDAFEKRQRDKYARLETALSQLNNQSSALTAALARMNAQTDSK